MRIHDPVRATSAVDESAWVIANGTHRCPVCEGDDGCKVHDGEGFVSCTQVRSEWPLTSGAWLHRNPVGGGGLAASERTMGARSSVVIRSRAELAHRFERLYAPEARTR